MSDEDSEHFHANVPKPCWRQAGCTIAMHATANFCEKTVKANKKASLQGNIQPVTYTWLRASYYLLL